MDLPKDAPGCFLLGVLAPELLGAAVLGFEFGGAAPDEEPRRRMGDMGGRVGVPRPAMAFTPEVVTAPFEGVAAAGRTGIGEAPAARRVRGVDVLPPANGPPLVVEEVRGAPAAAGKGRVTLTGLLVGVGLDVGWVELRVEVFVADAAASAAAARSASLGVEAGRLRNSRSFSFFFSM